MRNRSQLRAKSPSMHHTPDLTLQHLNPHVTNPIVADDPQPVTSPVNESPPCHSYRRSICVQKSVERLISTMWDQQCIFLDMFVIIYAKNNACYIYFVLMGSLLIKTDR